MYVFSKGVELIPMKMANATEVWQVLYEHVFRWFDMPFELITDHGRDFYVV